MADEEVSVTVVTITGRELYDKLTAVHTDVQALKTLGDNLARTMERHESRLTALEKWRYSAGAALVTAFGSAAITLTKAIGAH